MSKNIKLKDMERNLFSIDEINAIRNNGGTSDKCIAILTGRIENDGMFVTTCEKIYIHNLQDIAFSVIYEMYLQTS